jgi:hypothetical protein
VPSTSGTAVQLTGVEAPGATGQYDLVLGDTGGRPDLSLTTEWGAGYLTGNTQAFQQLGRTMAYNMASMPVHAVETSTGKIPSILNAAGTPAGLGGHYELTYWGGGATPSSNINGGVKATGGTGGWSFAGSAVAHMPSGSYIVWLMEGAPPLRDIMAQYGNGQAAGLTFATGGTLPVRNMVVSGTTYYGSSTCVGNGTNQREYAWRTLALLNLVRSSINGSDEETYGRNFLHSSLEECAAYEAYKGADYLNNGLPFYDEATIPIAGATIGSQQVSPFEIGYLAGVVGLGALMEGDYEADWTTQLNFIAKWLVYVYGGNSSPACPYYANSFDISPGLSSWGASAPASYISSLADLGLSPGEQTITFANNGATITLPSGFSWTLATGDKFKPSNYQNSSNFQLGHTPPAPFSPGSVNYIVGNPSGSTFEANTGGSSIIATGATTTQTITAASWASGTKLVTITTASPHGITNNNNTIIIAGMTPAAYNGTRGATVVNTTTFTYGLANDPGTATVMGTESPLISAWFVPSGQLTCPSGMILQHNAQAPDVYVTEHAMELAIMARAGVTGASTAYTNALNRWAGSSNAAANFATGMGWAGAP